MGFAIDFGTAFLSRSKLQSAVDAAALAAAKASDNENFDADSVVGSFVAASKLSYAKDIATTTQTSPAEGIKVSATANVPTAFMKLIGVSSVPIAATATAAQNRSLNRLNIHFYIDRSASMGIASTTTDRDDLIALTSTASIGGEGCAFACHYYDSSQMKSSYSSTNYYNMAKANGIRLREDDMLLAANSVVTGVFGKSTPGAAKMTVYGFSDGSQKLATITSASSDIKSILAGFSLKPWGTRLDLLMPNIPSEVTGTMVSGERGIVVLATDGWIDQYGVGTDRPMEAELCNQIKNANLTLVVVNLKYPQLPGQPWMTTVEENYDTLQARMKACASPGYYFEGDQIADITSAFEKAAEAIVVGNTASRLLR